MYKIFLTYIVNGPLCEEEMYGVIFLIEEIKFNKTNKDIKPKESEENKNTENPEKKIIPKPDLLNINFVNEFGDILSENKNADQLKDNLENKTTKSPEHLIKSIKTECGNILLDETNSGALLNNLQDDNKTGDDAESLSSKQMNIFGPLIGQITGTIKDCCRNAFLNSDPRLYEALYLCFFQIKQESIGQIHSVINKRRGKVKKNK